uniref:RNA helicase n=1 Tax=Sparus aurata TaxID=8175 RepID=A0A671YK78_SPAAU
MLTAVRCMLSKLVSPLWRAVEVNGEDTFSGASGKCNTPLKNDVVTQLCLDYGMIDDVIYFTSGEVLGGTPLKVGDLVNGVAVRDGAQGGWKALRVEKSADAWEDGGRTSLEADGMQLRPLIGTVTSFDGDGGYINQTTYFPRYSLWEGYEPMKGDWVQAKYSISPTQWTTQAQSVAPLRYCRLDQVHVTSVYGNNGVVEDSVFFSLDSLLLPANYQPLPGHLVNLVMVESSQSLYTWRALCIAVNVSAKPQPEAELKSLLENKGDLHVTDYGVECLCEALLCVFVSTTKFLVGTLLRSLGSCAELLLLRFSTFTIGRRLEVTVGSEEGNLLQPSVPYSPSDVRQVSAMPAHVVTVSAPKDPPRLSKRRLPSFLQHYPLPQALRDCVESTNDVLVFQPCLGEVLSPCNMHSRFSALLWLEELHAEGEMREFTISGAFLRKGAGYLHLEVPGLAEGRPSLNIGDRIVLKKPQSNGVVMEYVSYVTEIHDENVSLRVNSEFQDRYLGEPLDIEFTYNRLEKSLHLSFHKFLFPTRVTIQPPQWTGEWIEDKGHFFNPDLNPPQREAVKRILAGECRPTPYVLFGPPGTGKTITLIEAILQVYHFVPSSRILVCTPSNSAADLICVRLHHSGFLHSASLARVNASCRQEEVLHKVLRLYSRAGEDIRHACFNRIVVSTCSSAGMFQNMRLVGHFTHVFLDEAGQATEPESLIPISLISEKDGQIVLAGDPCQLGPVVKSKLAAAFGLGVSLLERLMANPLYSRHDWGYNPKLVTKLIYNYRSHEALLTLPSKLFYQGELCFKASKAIVESLCQWKTLPKKGFPLLHHGVRGTEMREGNNPSWFNPVEAVQVMLYCCQLAKKLYNPVDVSDIGIIAPYKKQCEKIRVLLGKVGLSDIKVGSVEEFQGQEFLVIILSTVRSNESLESDDLQNVLGFLSNPKRFNVAVTRPKALLIIVGNPHILIRDPCFRVLLQYCFINGAYLGCDPPPSLRDSQMYCHRGVHSITYFSIKITICDDTVLLHYTALYFIN